MFQKTSPGYQGTKEGMDSTSPRTPKKGFTDEHLSNLKAESVKYELLEFLKKEQYPGPFTTVEEVKLFLESLLEDKIKNNRLYKEIKYARMTCMSLQPTAAIFRLMRNHRKLETKEYADNLITYLDSACTCRTITLDDLSNVLHGLSGKAKNGTNTEVPSSTELPFAVGDYVAAFWFDGQYKWYLGVVDNVREDIVTVSYMARSDSCGRRLGLS